jgi:hypothetical protein
MLGSFESLFILTGIALIVVGFNSNRPLVIVGAGLIFLAALERFLRRRDRWA